MHEFLDDLTSAWNSHDLERVIQFYAPDYKGIDVGMASPQRGRDGLARMFANYWQAFPDLHFVEEERVVGDGSVALVWNAHGTHRGRFMRIPPTRRLVEVHGASFLKIEDQMVTHGRYIWDLAGVLRGIGLLPELTQE